MSAAEPNGRLVMVGSGAAAVPEQRDPSAATLPLRWLTPGLAHRSAQSRRYAANLDRTNAPISARESRFSVPVS